MQKFEQNAPAQDSMNCITAELRACMQAEVETIMCKAAIFGVPHLLHNTQGKAADE